MKVLFFLLTILFYSCTDIYDLNDKIFEAQKLAALQSPYKSAKGTNAFKTQKDFRVRKLPNFIRNKIFPETDLKDTIYMIEAFDAICISCPSDRMEILIKDTIYSFQREIIDHNKIEYKSKNELFNPISENFDYKLRNSELIEIVNKIRNNKDWKDSPLQYGSDDCNDGDFTFVTVIYPNKKIEALYVRCWMPYFYRTNGK